MTMARSRGAGSGVWLVPGSSEGTSTSPRQAGHGTWVPALRRAMPSRRLQCRQRKRIGMISLSRDRSEAGVRLAAVPAGEGAQDEGVGRVGQGADTAVHHHELPDSGVEAAELDVDGVRWGAGQYD